VVYETYLGGCFCFRDLADVCGMCMGTFYGILGRESSCSSIFKFLRFKWAAMAYIK
jgi:hypothetical protein